MKEYMPRIADKIIEEKMKSIGGILIEGCKWCGKSTTGKKHAKTILEFQDVDNKNRYEMINKTKPSLFLEGEKPLLIDEWQTYPIVWDAIRMDVDRTSNQGDYILTGSSKPKKGTTMHSGTGRIGRILMRPMSLYESKESDGKISLNDLFAGVKDLSAVANISFDDIIYYILRGGWPIAKKLGKKEALEVSKNYYNSLIHEDDTSVEQEYDPAKLNLLLRSLSRNVSSPINLSTVEKDITSQEETLARNTIEKYISILKKLFIVENTPAWNGKTRSKTAIRTKEKLELVDPSIACAALDLNETTLKNDLNTLGLLFENLCMRDLKIYTDALGGNIYYYRDESGLEVDAIIVLQNGDWGAIEIKLGSGFIEEASNNLLKFKSKIDTDKLGEPKFLMILTGEEYSYQLDNGIYIVSIGNLKN